MDISTGLGLAFGAVVLVALIMMGGDLRMFLDLHAFIVIFGGATAATLTIDPATTGDAGAYHCVATNACGQAVSDAALLSITPGLCRGDANCDGAIGLADIDRFVAGIPNNEAGWAAMFPGGSPPVGCTFANCDVNGNGNVGFDDIDPFVALIPSACP